MRSAARAAARRGDWLAAAHHYRSLVQTGSARAEDRVQLGHALKEQGNDEGALLAYGDAARLHPLNLDAQRQYGLFLRRLNRNSDALDVLARALAIDPAAFDVRAEVADMGANDEALLDPHYLRGILGSEGVKAHRAVGPILYLWAERSLIHARRSARARDWTSAESHYRNVLRRSPDRVGARVQLGHSLLEQGRIVEALAAYRRALVDTPREADIYLHIGHALKSLERRDSAFGAYLTAWRLKPGLGHALVELQALRPELDKDILFADAQGQPNWGRHHINEPQSTAVHSEPLSPPRWLDRRQSDIFKLLAGSISIKE